MPIPTNPESRAVNMVEDDLLAMVRILPVPASLPQTVNLAYVVEVPKATSSVEVVKLTVVPESVQPEVLEEEMQTPDMAKQPAVIFKPLANVEVELEVDKSDPPVMVNPLELDSPAVDTAPVKVVVPVPVTAKLVVVALVVVELVATNPNVVNIPETLALPEEVRYVAAIPAEKVEVAAEVFKSDPPEIDNPLVEESPAVEMPPVNVDVPAPVTVKLTV